ncbi:hypothetical protein [Streptomyces alfalfae]
MLEAITGGLVGALAALLGTLLIVRDSRRARESAAEERAAAALLTQLRRVRLDPDFLRDEGAALEFLEECMTSVLAFRDREVRNRLRTSVGMISTAYPIARDLSAQNHVEPVYGLAFHDIWRCLEARLDRRRLPRPRKAWTEASTNLHSWLGEARDEFDAIEEAWDAQQLEMNERLRGL